MKKSEFLNKTKEELQEIFDGLTQLAKDDYVDDEVLEQLDVLKMLITDESILKVSINTAADRENMLVLAETTKALLNTFKLSQEQGNEIDDIDPAAVLMNAAIEGIQNGKARAAELEKDFEDDGENVVVDEMFMDDIIDKMLKVNGFDDEEVAEFKEENKEELAELLKTIQEKRDASEEDLQEKIMASFCSVFELDDDENDNF